MIRHWLGSMLFALTNTNFPGGTSFTSTPEQCVGIDKSGAWTLYDCQLNLTAVICQQNRGTYLDIASITITI